MNLIIKFALVCSFVNNFTQGVSEDEKCVIDGAPAKCVLLPNCTAALNDIKERTNPTICSFHGKIPVVCCKDGLNTTEPVQMRNDQGSDKKCPPLSHYITETKTGQKSRDKCIEYQEQLLYPCVKETVSYASLSSPPKVQVVEKWLRTDFCGHAVDDLIVGGGGIDSLRGQFPHMALLGYGAAPSVEWQCGGSVISDRFILTAGHCISSSLLGPVKYAILDILKRSELRDDSMYSIKNIIKHPEYNPPSKYHDIALLEVDKPIKLSKNIVPICLHTGETIPNHIVSATGWGALGRRGENAEILQDVPLWKVPDANCSIHYPPHRLFTRGYDPATQMCYGDDGTVRDTCTGDSGGPVQIRNGRIRCMYTIVGVTSFGRECGVVGYPGIYTRISYYVPWIESIVWP